MSEVRDYTWSPEVETDLVLESLRSAVFGDIPAYVLTAEGRRAKATDIGKIKDELARALTEADGYNMIGYSVVFNQWTNITDQRGNYLEQVAPGATAKTIKERGDRIIVQFDHGHHPLVGSIPVASPRAVWEDGNGLFGWDRLHQSWLFEPVREAIKSGAIRGQSFRFSIPDGGETVVPARGKSLERRTLTEVSILERGPVVWPAYAGTEVAVRALVRAMPKDLRAAAASAYVTDNGAYIAGDDSSGILDGEGTEEPAAHEGTGDAAAEMCEPALGVTRRELQRMALPIIVGDPNVQASGDAA